MLQNIIKMNIESRLHCQEGKNIFILTKMDYFSVKVKKKVCAYMCIYTYVCV